MTAIALLRHFPTDWNLEHRLQGQVDRPLTADARAALKTLQIPPPWDQADIVASPLSRAADTAAALAHGRPIRHDPRLVETSWGDWEGLLSADLLANPASGFVHMEDWGWTRRPPGGESPQDAWDRLAPALAEIAGAGRPALLVIHRGLMRVILARAWGWDFDRPEPFRIKRARLYPLRLSPEGWPREPEEPVRLVERA